MQKSTAISFAANVVLTAVVIFLWHELESTPQATPTMRESAGSEERPAVKGDSTSSAIASAPQSGDPPDSTADHEDDESISDTEQRPAQQVPDRPAVIRRTDVLAARSSAKNNYRDFVLYARLNPEQQRQFYDLAAVYMEDLQEQRNPHRETPIEYPYPAEREFRAGLEALLGTAGAAKYQEYDEAGMALLEIANLSQQLEGRDLPLSEDQRARLLHAAIEHRQVFTDAYEDAQSFTENRWVVTPWKADILRLYRLETLALPILSADQMTSITDLRETRIALSQLGR